MFTDVLDVCALSMRASFDRESKFLGSRVHALAELDFGSGNENEV